MNPDQQQGGQPQSPQDAGTSGQQASQREAATNVIRTQIDSLYNGGAPAQTAAAPAVPNDDPNPYDRTHEEKPIAQADQWQEYHSAWQNYYQKYYESYYTQQLKTQPAGNGHYFSHAAAPEPEAGPKESVSQEQALYDLRHQLLSKVQTSAKKVRRSRHFIPIIAALTVMLVFAFLQYNTLITGTVLAYVSPGTVNPQDIVVDPNDDVAVSQASLLIIPKINVDVPVLYGVGSDYNSQMAAMAKGVADFSIPGANAVPGEIGNTAVAGHSSNDLFDTGDYKFIFAQLDKLVDGDTVYMDYKGVRYTYVVTNISVVAPTDVAALEYTGDKPILTLITCTPLGTSKNRLLVTAEQVSPDPSTAIKAPTSATTSASTIPGANAPSIFQKLFGAGG